MVILPASLPPSPSIDTHTDTLRELSACHSGSAARRQGLCGSAVSGWWRRKRRRTAASTTQKTLEKEIHTNWIYTQTTGPTDPAGFSQSTDIISTQVTHICEPDQVLFRPWRGSDPPHTPTQESLNSFDLLMKDHIFSVNLPERDLLDSWFMFIKQIYRMCSDD